jgi:hypothetical protein
MPGPSGKRPNLIKPGFLSRSAPKKGEARRAGFRASTVHRKGARRGKKPRDTVNAGFPTTPVKPYGKPICIWRLESALLLGFLYVRHLYVNQLFAVWGAHV